MACEVKNFAKIRDFRKVQEYFGLSHDDSWFNSVNYAISPTSELIAIGQGEKLALLSSSWDNKLQVTTFALSWCGELDDPNQIITSIICLPIYGKNVSSGAEWTCVALGLSSGTVVFYTDSGLKIFSQSYQEDPVLAIKSITPRWDSESDSFVHIIYDQCVCFVKGADLFPLLNYSKNNLSRCISRSMGNAGIEMPDTIPFQKFKFPRERDTVINDAIVAGSRRSRTFDHIVEQSMSCGYYAKVTDFPAQNSLVLGVGAEPYLGFYYAEEGYRTISLGDVAKDVIGIAYKSFIGSFFGASAPATQQEEVANITKESPMRSRCRIFDSKRDGYNVWIAPRSTLAAVADNLDRVILVDCTRGVAIRVWKGYRDAQCAFIRVKEKTLKGDRSERRKALFLLIYAPHLGCLEIWALQNGPKVAAFTVSKNGQLAYNNHGLLGVPPGTKIKANINACLFFDPADGSLNEVIIPFHYALSESNSKTSRDVHLMRRLKTMLRDVVEHSEEQLRELESICSEFQTDEVRLQCLEMLTKNKQIKPQVFRALVYAFSKSLSDVPVGETIGQTCGNLRQLLTHYKRLVDFYIAMKEPVSVEFDETLHLSECDLKTIQQIVQLLGNRRQSSAAATGIGMTSSKVTVTFQEKHKHDGDFVEYLGIFRLDESSVRLNREKQALFGYISGNLFMEFFEHGLCVEQFKTSAEQSTIPCEDLLVLILNYWLEKPFVYKSCEEVVDDMTRLSATIRAICDLAGDKVNSFAYNSICPWWQEVRELLLESPRSLGLLVAIVCKTVASDLKRQQREGSCEEISQADDADRWEQISQDEAQWSLLIGKLDDIAVLGAILEYPVTSTDPIMPELPYEKPDCSLKFIVGRGKGVVTDLTAQWLTNSRIHPLKIVESETETETTTLKSNDIDPILCKLACLREHFPFSLESGVLLSLMSWEYMVHWSKNLQSLEHMRAGLICLAAFKKADMALKHGMCCMIWNATIKYPLQSTMKLIQKVGCLPAEKFCQQEIGFSASLMTEFLEICLEFLDHFATSLEHDKRELRFEESLADGQLPLQFIALQQHNAIKEVLQLHNELCTVLHFITYFQLKIPKPITTVFDAMSNKTFFSDINKELQYILPAPDRVLQKQREDFLCKVITASMDLIREDLEQLYILDHIRYMEKVCALADLWKLDKAGLKRRQVVEMYANSWDAYAEELLQDIVDDEHVGKLLLEIAGRRMNLFTKSSSDTFMKVASVGPQLLQYLDNLDEDRPNSIQISASSPDEIDLVAMSKLTINAFECLSKRETKFVHIAAQMFDACSLVQE